jgi:uncharacterized protein (DUF1501 family)
MSDLKRNLTRRSMLATGWAAVAGSAIAGQSGAPQPGQSNPSQASRKGSRTLVCLYLLGGSDGSSLVAPLDPPQYRAYANTRGELALRADALLPIRSRSAGTPYGLDPRLGELQRFFNDGSAALWPMWAQQFALRR